MNWLLEFLFGPEPQPQPQPQPEKRRVNTANLPPIPDSCPMCGGSTSHMRVNKNYGDPYIQWGCGAFASTGCEHTMRCKPFSYSGREEKL